MKKAANVIFRVAGIISIVLAAIFLLAGIAMSVAGDPRYFSYFVEGLQSGAITSDLPGTVEEVAFQIQNILMTLGVIYIVVSVFAIVNAILSFKGRNSNKKFVFILNIVFSILSFVEVNLVASIFALIKGDTIE